MNVLQFTFRVKKGNIQCIVMELFQLRCMGPAGGTVTEVAFICYTNGFFNNSFSDSHCSVELSDGLLLTNCVSCGRKRSYLIESYLIEVVFLNVYGRPEENHEKPE